MKMMNDNLEKKENEWTNSNPVISKELLEGLINGIKTGEHITLTQYSSNKEKQTIFDEGQISAFELLLEWINYKENGKSKN